jgi:hypothetical protein
MRTVDHAIFAVKFGRNVLKIRNPIKLLSFCVGNLLPDYSFHTYCKSIGHGFRTARKKLVLAWQSRYLHGETCAFYFRLGVAAHYLCDSFTFPHNRRYKGNLSGHIHYENAMHELFLRRYLPECGEIAVFCKPESCMRYMEKQHMKYLRQSEASPADDLRWIADSCLSALISTFCIPKNYNIDIGNIL